MLECVLPSEDANHWCELDWLHPTPFLQLWRIDRADLDHYQHTNNTSYVKQTEQLAWAHSNALGLTFEHYQALDRAMVIVHHDLHYLAPSHLNDQLACATWITNTDKKFRLQRQFQFIQTSTNKTIFKATTDFVCVTLSTGLPKKMPESFIDAYGRACLNK